MKFHNFRQMLCARGFTLNDIYIIDRIARQFARQSFLDEFECGNMPELENKNEFNKYCVEYGRDFIHDMIVANYSNLEILETLYT